MLRIWKVLALCTTLAFPAVSLAEISLSVDANLIDSAQSDSTGFGLGAALGADMLELGPIALGPQARIGFGGVDPDLSFWHGALGPRLSLDLLVVLSAAARVGVGRVAPDADDPTWGEGRTGPLLETELSAELPLLAILTIGARVGYSNILLRGEDFGWTSYGLLLGLRL